MTSLSALERQARYVLLSSLAEDRRVLDLGCGDGRGLVLLAEGGATELTGVSSDLEAATAALEAQGVEGVELKADSELPLPFEDASFDLVVCHDLPDRIAASPEWLTEVRRVLSPEGYLALTVANPNGRAMTVLGGDSASSALAYEEVVARVGEHFAATTVFGQSPMIASMFQDFEEEDPGIELDRSLVDDAAEQPGWYILVFGPQAFHKEDLVIAQQSFGRLIEAIPNRTVELPSTEPSELAAQYGEMLEELERRAREAEERAAQLEESLTAGGAAVAAESATGPDFEARLSEALALASSLEGQIAEQRRRAETAEERVAALAARSELPAAAAEEMQELRARTEGLAKNNDALQEQIDIKQHLVTEQEELLERARLQIEQLEVAAATAREAGERERSQEAAARAQQAAEEIARARSEAEGRAAAAEQEAATRMAELERRTEAQLSELRAALADRVAEAQRSAEELVTHAEQQAQARFAEVEAQLETRVAEARSEAEAASVEALQAAEQRAAEAEARVRAAEERAEAVAQQEAGLADKLQAAEQRAAEAEACARAAEEAKSAAQAQAEERIAEAVRRTEERVAAAEAAGAAAAGDMRAKIAELERELEQVRVDKESFATQIKDLLEEGEKARAAQAKVAQLEDEIESWRGRDQERAQTMEAARVHAEAQLEELARLKLRVQSLEDERDSLTGELQRQREAVAARGAPSSPVTFEEDTVANELVGGAVFGSASHSHDSVGREIETSLEEIEELITSAVPPPRR